MKALLKNELLFIDILTVLLIICISLSLSRVIQLILGLPFILFFPGYTLIAALFPRKDNIDGIERSALSFVLSIAMVSVVGLILNFTPWKVRLYPVLTSIAIFIVFFSAVASIRRQRLPAHQRFTIIFGGDWLSWLRNTGKPLNIILIFMVLVVIALIAYIVVIPQRAEKFTEFYVLGAKGESISYPGKLRAGEEGRVLLVITNHEQGETSYSVEVIIANRKKQEISPITLKNEEKWQQEVGFILESPGEKQKVEFVLNKNGVPYRQLLLWFDVVQ